MKSTVGNMTDLTDIKDLYKKCRLCPRKCGVNRAVGERGFCGAGANPYVARAALHQWEEPCLSGTNGSGTVFFSGCSLGCVFCQNAEISRGAAGKEIDTARLSDIFLELEEKGAHNINLVSSSHYTPSVIEALDLAKARGLKIPIVYNSSGYESADTLRLLEGYIDIYLPDFKYVSSVLSEKYSHAKDYSERAKETLAEMVRQQPRAVFDESGIMQRGVIVRHLMLPDCARDSRAVLEYLYKTYGDSIYISIMRQFTPTAELTESHPELFRRITDKEYGRMLDFCDALGIERGFSQETGCEEESFIPPFDLEGV